MMRRLLVENIPREQVVLSGEQHHRVTRVLRLRQGDALRIFDGRGNEYEATVESADRAQATVRVTRAVPPLPEPRVKITLFQSVPRGDAMERVIQKCVEVGVSQIVPVITGRTVARPSEEGAKLARWRTIALHAVEQSGRAWLVPVADPIDAEAVAARLPSFDLALVPHVSQPAGVCHPEHREESPFVDSASASSLRSMLASHGSVASLAIVIGPEGGFSTEEIDGFVAAGARIVSLGPRVLRSETAGLVAATIVLYHYGEMG